MRAQLTLSFGGLAGLIIVIAVISITSFLHQFENFERYVNGIRARSEAAHLVREAVDLRAIAARNLVLVTTPAERDAETRIVNQAQADVTANLRRLKELAQAPSVPANVRALIDKIATIEKAYEPVALSIVELALHDKKEEAIVKMNEQCRPLLASLIAASREYGDVTTARSAAMIAEAERDYARVRNLLVAASLIAVALAVVAGAVISRRLLKALGAEPADLCDAVSRVAGGDLTGALQVRAGDTGSVLAAVHRMQSSLSEVVSSVRRDSDTVSTAATEISSGNNDLSTRTEQQASSLQETASSMEQLTATVRQNADNAQQANALAVAASDIAARGGAVVGQVVGTMDSISAASRQIVDIISVIEGIAFQTNILALNAAVEAARAGDQGRGFAVVATEVRNLAQRSAGAAKEIKILIDNSVERVDLGARLAIDAGATMTEVVDSVRRVTDMIADIMSASQEQSDGIEQVNLAIGQMDNVTQQNASLVEEAAAAAESLRHQASNLVRTVSAFKIHGDGGHHAAPALVRAFGAPVRQLAAAIPTPARRASAATAGWEEF
ncbi:MCP four helix bundle domain-containing protein [Duganella sp. LX20W]|uniref:MCP four helix bundle domain-containing protein n=1 Tax=Rugamonas brunnea TaxID=2758569 RepID=A0A7W2EWT3_9BURK|nr:methyl-accepting chemotaxis protein [Rugamonas brunnea]MBA5640042.1 MCP four helix bundle domain-containing protein [Rugamonas brunnea]